MKRRKKLSTKVTKVHEEERSLLTSLVPLRDLRGQSAYLRPSAFICVSTSSSKEEARGYSPRSSVRSRHNRVGPRVLVIVDARVELAVVVVLVAGRERGLGALDLVGLPVAGDCVAQRGLSDDAHRLVKPLDVARQA